MVFKLGSEPLAEFYEFELAQAAYKLVTEMRPVKPGQNVLISADTASDMRVVKATAGAVLAVGGTPTVVWHPKLDEPMSPPPEPLSKAVTGADIWIDYAVAYQLYSPAYEQAIEAGCIYVCLTGMDVDMLVRTVGRAPYAPMQEMAEWLYRQSQAAKRIHVASPAGTELWMAVDPAGDPFWEPPPESGGYPQMLGGQSGFMAVRESYEGILVFDGALWPPSSLGLLRQPIKLVLEKGYIQAIEGGAEARVYERWLEGAANPLAYLMEHACYGFNPGVTQPTGRILEDERVFGCMQFGVGATPFGSPVHSDGVILNPSVWLDDLQIEAQGRYVHPELIEFCKRMGVVGY